MNWEDIAEQKMQPPMLPYVQGPGDPSNFEEYDPEDPVTPDEVYDEEYLMVRPTYAYRGTTLEWIIWSMVDTH